MGMVEPVPSEVVLAAPPPPPKPQVVEKPAPKPKPKQEERPIVQPGLSGETPPPPPTSVKEWVGQKTQMAVKGLLTFAACIALSVLTEGLRGPDER